MCGSFVGFILRNVNLVKMKFKNIFDLYKDVKSISFYFEFIYEVFGICEVICMFYMFLRLLILIKKS